MSLGIAKRLYHTLGSHSEDDNTNELYLLHGPWHLVIDSFSVSFFLYKTTIQLRHQLLLSYLLRVLKSKQNSIHDTPFLPSKIQMLNKKRLECT